MSAINKWNNYELTQHRLESKANSDVDRIGEKSVYGEGSLSENESNKSLVLYGDNHSHHHSDQHSRQFPKHSLPHHHITGSTYSSKTQSRRKINNYQLSECRSESNRQHGTRSHTVHAIHNKKQSNTVHARNHPLIYDHPSKYNYYLSNYRRNHRNHRFGSSKYYFDHHSHHSAQAPTNKYYRKALPSPKPEFQLSTYQNNHYIHQESVLKALPSQKPQLSKYQNNQSQKPQVSKYDKHHHFGQQSAAKPLPPPNAFCRQYNKTDHKEDDEEDKDDDKQDDKQDDVEYLLYTSQIGMDTVECSTPFGLKVRSISEPYGCLERECSMIDSFEKRRYLMLGVGTIPATVINVENRYKNVVQKVCGGFFQFQGTHRFMNDIFCVPNVQQVISKATLEMIDNKSVECEDMKDSWRKYMIIKMDDIAIKIYFSHTFECSLHTLYFYGCIKISSNGQSFKLYFRCHSLISGFEYPRNNVFSNKMTSKYHKIFIKREVKLERSEIMGILMNKNDVLVRLKKVSKDKKKKWKELTCNMSITAENFNKGWSEMDVLISTIARKVITPRDTFAMDIRRFYNKQYNDDEMSSWSCYKNVAKLNNDIFTRLLMANIGNITYTFNEEMTFYQFVIPCAEVYGCDKYGIIATITID